MRACCKKHVGVGRGIQVCENSMEFHNRSCFEVQRCGDDEFGGSNRGSYNDSKIL